jgi:signal transduction histidine kinase
MALARNDQMLDRGAAPERPLGRSTHRSLLEISQAIGSSLELDTVLNTFLNQTLKEIHAQQGSVLLFDEQQDRLRMLASIGLPEEMVRKGYIPRKGSIAEFVIENNRPLILNDSPTNTTYQALDGRRRIISAMCVPLRASGKVLGTVNLNRTDVSLPNFVDTDLETMTILASQAAIFIENSRLHESNMKAERLAAIGQTVAGISHCVKNLLTGVRGGLSLIDMARQSQDWNLIGQGGDILKRNLERLSALVLDMLDYSKERKPATGPVDVSSLLKEVGSTIESAAKAKKIEIVYEIEPPILRVEADAQAIYRCLLNLAHNSVDAMSENGRLTLSAVPREMEEAPRRLRETGAPRAIVLRVRDTGTGIDADNAVSIFEPFFSTKGSKGTGLGLAVTRKIVEEHGGVIELETRAPDPACFAIYLPEAVIRPAAS